MYSLKDNGVISEITCGNNFEYILEDNSHFVDTDFKVLQSQTSGSFVQCMKMKRNGKLDLYYVTDNYRPMSSMFVGLTADVLITVVINLFASVIEVRNNGFLVCQCIDLSWDKIFVDNNTLKVRLVYIPVTDRVFDSYAQFESELRSSIVKLINKVIVNVDDRLKQFVLDLCDGNLSLEDVYNKSRSAGMPELSKEEAREPKIDANAADGVIKLMALNAPNHFELMIDEENVLIGKKPELVDKVIAFNPMISRKHCRIKKTNDEYYICDEGSANGTYVNGVKCAVGESVRINKGDVIRLANSDFRIV